MSRETPVSTRTELPVSFVVVFLFLTIEMMAQLPTATLLGVVQDSSGAVMPNASMTVRNVETGLTRTATSAAGGSYRFSALPVGNYEIRVEHPGFQTVVRSGLNLTVGQEAVVNFTLEVGAVEQTIAVTAEAPLVNTTSGSLGGLVGEEKVSDLPLNGRNFIDLTLLQTGVQQHNNMSFVGAGMRGTWFSSNGSPLASNNLLLDGAMMNNLYGSHAGAISGSTLGVEGVREYRVVTNAFSAEYGMTMGSQSMIVSKNGTDDFHGSLFEYHRNSALDARNFFDYKTEITPRRLPALTRNNFGGSIGGPIRRDRMFFHTVLELVRERRGNTSVFNTMDAAAKVDGELVPQISPLVKPWLRLYPEPNLSGNRATFPAPNPTDDNYGQERVDYTISNNDNLFVRYTVHDANISSLASTPDFISLAESRAQYATLSESHIFSPTLLNTARLSFSRTHILSDSPSGLIGPEFSFVPGKEFGGVGITGLSSPGPLGTDPTVKTQNIFTWSDDVFYTAGPHSLKFGTLINRFGQYMLVSSGHRGSISFANLTNFLRGVPRNYSATTLGSIQDRTYEFSTYGFYLQDDWRVNSRFTLNLGLRYEFNTELQEIRGHGAALRDIQHDVKPTLGPPVKNNSLRNLSPRFGFAWDPRGDGRTALRGGFALLYNINMIGAALLAGAAASAPFSSQSTVNPAMSFTLPLFFPPESVGKTLRTVDYLMEQPHMLHYNLTVERELPHDMVVTLAYGGSRGINIIQNVDGNPTVAQVLSDGRYFWVGNESRTNPNWDDITMQTAGGNSWYNSMQFGMTKRLSRGLQFQSSYTWAKLIDETQGQLAGEQSGAGSSISSWPTDRKVDKGPAAFDVAHNWRFNAIYRLPQFVSGGSLSQALLNRWRVSTIMSLNTGLPFTPVLGTNRSRSKIGGGGGGTDRPDLASGRSSDNIVQGSSAGCSGVAAGRKLGGRELYYDPCAFTIPSAGFLGTSGRNVLRGPGLATLDFSLAKDTPLGILGESGTLEFRAEFFNLLNRVNFGVPSRTVYSASQDVEAALTTAGQINSASKSRQIQLALKIVF